MEEKKEPIWKSFLFYPFRLIASIMSALSMDDKGLSLKKILALWGTWIAVEVTEKHACKENAIAFVIVWLVWVGILVGIYSIKDITDAIGKYKGSDKPTDLPKT